MTTFKHHIVLTDVDNNFYFASDDYGFLSLPFLYGDEGDPQSWIDYMISDFFKLTKPFESEHIGFVSRGSVTAVTVSEGDGQFVLDQFRHIRRLTPEETMRAIYEQKIHDTSSLAAMMIVSAYGTVKAVDGV